MHNNYCNSKRVQPMEILSKRLAIQLTLVGSPVVSRPDLLPKSIIHEYEEKTKIRESCSVVQLKPLVTNCLEYRKYVYRNFGDS